MLNTVEYSAWGSHIVSGLYTLLGQKANYLPVLLRTATANLHTKPVLEQITT